LDFRGRFYQHTLMTPMFRPAPHGHGLPPIVLAGVGTKMLETAGRIADGVLVHGFTTPRHLRTVILPTIERGLASGGRLRRSIEVGCRGFLVTGRDEQELDRAKQAVRERIAFYASTPAYRPVLDSHGWGEIGDLLTALSRSGDEDRWSKMAALIDDEILESVAVVAEPERAGDEILRRYTGLADRYWYYTPYPVAPEAIAQVTLSLRERSEPEGTQTKWHF